MRKRVIFIMATVCALLITGCGTSNSVEDLAGVNSQMTENTGQTDAEENVASENITAAFMNEIQEPTGEEEWDDKALMEAYAANGIEKDGNFYYYQGELIYIIKDQCPDSSVYLLNTDSKGTVSIKVIRNAEGEITGVSYMTEEEVEKALSRILSGADFYLEMQDEETDEWRELDESIMLLLLWRHI